MTLRLATHIITFLWAAIILYWIARAFGNKRTRVRRQRGVLLVYGLIVVVTGSVLGHLHGLRVNLFPVTALTELLGIAICVAGLGLAVWARNILGRNWSGLVVIKEDHELIQSGPYRWVRHPLYTGLLTGILGSVIAVSPTGRAFALVVLWIVLFSFKARSEERAMTQEFGERYGEYRARVRWAIFPLLY
jgi:protein-S-isoprenylcysteine O-methyltransferase Ste14